MDFGIHYMGSKFYSLKVLSSKLEREQRSSGSLFDIWLRPAGSSSDIIRSDESLGPVINWHSYGEALVTVYGSIVGLAAQLVTVSSAISLILSLYANCRL